ncbi:MAG: hypothetical protein LUD17_00170 [Bacteroidales bacterium]|nr:hypothetical protein [Bacteroidales bacterium]
MVGKKYVTCGDMKKDTPKSPMLGEVPVRAWRLAALLIALAVMAAALPSCHRHTAHWERMLHAESVIEEEPDSALAVVLGIDRAALSGERERALHGLLYTQAGVKRDSVFCSDSIIGPSAEYYRAEGDKPRLMRSLFYRGDIAHNRGELYTAMRDVYEAHELAAGLGDDYWRAKTAERISDIFASSYMYDEAERYTREAAEHYGRSGRGLNRLYSLCDLAYWMGIRGEREEALELMDSVLDRARYALGDSSLTAYALNNKAALAVQFGRLEMAQSSINEFESVVPARGFETNIDIYKIVLLMHQGDAKTVLSAIEQLKEEATTPARKAKLLELRLECLKALGEPVAAMACADSLLAIEASEFTNAINQAPLRAERDLSNLKAQSHQSLAKRLLSTLGLPILALLAVLLITVSCSRKAIHKKQSALDAIIRELCECQSTLKDTERVIKDHTNTIDSLIREGIESKSQLLKLEQDNKDISRRMDCILCNRQSEFVNQWRIVNLICQEYLEEESDPSMQKRMAKRFEKEMAKLRSEKSLRDIEAEVNAVFDNLISYFKKEMGNVSEEDRTMMV